MDKEIVARHRGVSLLLGGALGILGSVVLPLKFAPGLGSEFPELLVTDLLATLVAMVAGVVLHELGHLVAALSVGLPIGGVRVFGIRAGQMQAGERVVKNAVSVNLLNARTLVPLRMVIMTLAGPAVNLAIAWAALARYLDTSHADGDRAAAACVAAVSLIIGVGNLVPFTRGRTHSDGLQALRWAFTPSFRQAELVNARTLYGLQILDGEDDELTQLLRAAAVEPAPVAGPAAVRALALIARLPGGESRRTLWEVAPTMARVGQLGHPDPRVAIICCSHLSFTLAMERVLETSRTKARPTPAEVATIVELAEIGKTAARDSVEANYALAMARGLEDRSEDMRRLLIGLPLQDETPQTVARVHALRALAEVDLDDLPSAERLVSAAERAAPHEPVVRMARAALGVARRR